MLLTDWSSNSTGAPSREHAYGRHLAYQRGLYQNMLSLTAHDATYKNRVVTQQAQLKMLRRPHHPIVEVHGAGSDGLSMCSGCICNPICFLPWLDLSHAWLYPVEAMVMVQHK